MVFDPVVEIPLVLFSVVWMALVNGLRWRFLIFVFVVDMLIPAGYMLWGLKRGSLSDWDISKRQERVRLFSLTVVMHAVTVVYAFVLGKTELGLLLLVLWSLAIVFASITFVWKISVHAGVNGVLLTFFNHFWGWDNYWWLVIILLLVLWSRVEIKKHSWKQVFGGAQNHC